MTDPRLEWYSRAIASDPVKAARFDAAVERARSTPGTSDAMEAIDRLLSPPDR